MNSASNELLILALATPNQNSCRFCRHRTGCTAYLTELQDGSGFVEDGTDLIVTVASLPIPNGVGSIDFQMNVQTDDNSNIGFNPPCKTTSVKFCLAQTGLTS